MGKVFGDLTNSGTALDKSASNDEPIFIGTPSQVQQHLGQSRDALIKSGINNPVANPQPQPPFPTQGTPTAQQAASAGAQPGGVNALSPGLNKAGKLVTLLQGGLQGALAGRAASEQTVAQTGGRRSGGAGMGFEAAQAYPWQQLGRQLGAQQQQAQTGVLQSEAQNVNVPGMGPIPGWLAKTLGPAYLRQQGQLGSAQIGATSRENVAGTQQETQEKIHRYVPVPNVGLYDTQTRQVVPNTEQGITITPEIAADHNLPQEFIGKPMGLTQLAAIQRSDVFANVPQMTAQGPVIVNRKNAQAVPVTGPGGQRYSPPALASPREVADVNNPGQTTTVPAGQSFGLPGVQSASVQVPKRAATAEVPTKIGDLRIGYTTAIQHADLLRSAVTALNNKDQDTLNSLKNRLKAEFGVAGPVTAQAIADAYGREVTSVISKGHITNEEIGSVGKTLNVNRQSPEQSLGVLDAYKALMQSKMNMLNQQKQKAVTMSQPTNKQNDPAGIRP